MAEYIVNISEEIRDDGSQEILNKKPLIRCKDCKHRNTIFCFKDEQGFGTDDDWFCADGERK